VTITEFLLARIAEDEASLNGPYFRIEWVNPHSTSPNATWPAEAQWSDGRMLAECAAKRAIVEHSLDVERSYTEEVKFGMTPLPRIPGKDGWLYAYHMRPIVVALAAVYKDHPDYNPEWE
jgi:Family of unknown function (DUF6221)